VPPHSVVKLSSHPVEFFEPLGRDQLIMVAHQQPFDLANVLHFMQKSGPAASDDVLIFRSEVRIY
jgi:hypothetical protein